MAQSGFASDGLRSLSKELSAELKSPKKVAIGVLNFPYARGRTSTGSHLVSERLLTYLVQDGEVVIERRFIEKILEEKMLWESGLVDPASARKLATLLGVDVIVAGTLNDISDSSTEVIARVIKVDGAEILAAGSAIIPRLWSDFPRAPRLAQPSLAVPVASPQLGGLFQPVKRVPATSGSKRSRYRPAPVPGFSLPQSRKISGGSSR